MRKGWRQGVEGKKMSSLNWVNVLLIDDSPSILSYVSKVLNDAGIDKVTETTSAVAGLDKLQNSPEINLLFLDLNMPGMDGIECLNLLAESQYRGYLVIMSGVAPRIIMTVEELARRHNFNYLGTLFKPLSEDDITRVISRLGQKKQKHLAQPPLKIYEIIRAIKNADFEVLYQPQINLHDRSLHGVEALVRLKHPKLGVISPERFLDKIEHSDLMIQLTYMVMEKALQDWGRWHKRGLSPTVGVNVAPFVLQQSNFVDRTFELLEQHQVPASSLCVEITESTLAKDLQQELATLSRLNMRGIELALDDFGQDHASIERLQSLPLNTLKLDKSYFLAEKTRQSRITIIQSSIALAKRLHMLVVAEGIEDHEHWRLSAEMGCDVAQGYYLSRPMAAKELIHWHQTWQSQIA